MTHSYLQECTRPLRIGSKQIEGVAEERKKMKKKKRRRARELIKKIIQKNKVAGVDEQEDSV